MILMTLKNITAGRNLKLKSDTSDVKSYQVDYYSLDVIISVGYRVKSLRGTQFRIWTSSILKKYMKK